MVIQRVTKPVIDHN